MLKLVVHTVHAKVRKGEMTYLLGVTDPGQCDARHHTVRCDGTVCGAGICGLHPAAETAGGTGPIQAAGTR